LNRRYAKPPIIEAVLEFRYGGQGSIKEFERLSKALAKAHPATLDLVETSVGPAGESLTPPSLIYRRFISDDISDELLLTPNSLAVVRKAPYLGWKMLESRMRKEQRRAKRLFDGRPFARLGVRMVNRIDVDCEEDGLFDHLPYVRLTAAPLDFEHGPIAGLEVALATVLDGGRFGLTLHCQKAASPIAGKAAIILDMDVFNQAPPIMPTNEDELWEQVCDARRWKNKVFESLITDKARELFQ
jgi:uncharacterized protein (TIGR04255 family)